MSQKLIGCFIALLVSVGTALAQINYSLQTGSPTFSVASPVEMGFVNLANGNLHLEIPLGSYPERGGHTLTAKMVYDSRIWTVVNNGSESLWEPTNVSNSWSGWRFVTSADAGAVLPATVMTNCGGSNYYDTYSAFTWTAPDGTEHIFPITTLQDFGCSGVTAVSSGNAMAEDSTGYNMYVTNYTQATIYGPDGSIVHNDTQSVYSVKDPNGNYFSYDGSGNIVDTLGRTVAKKMVQGSSISYAIFNSEGTTSTFTVNTGSTTAYTDFNEANVYDYYGTITTVSSIGLPDGSTYQFTYDASANGSYAYALLQSMQLASGGTVNYTWATFGGNGSYTYDGLNRYLNTRVSGGGTTSYAYANPGSCGVTGDWCFTATLTPPNLTATVYTFAVNNGAWNIESTGSVLGTIVYTYDFSNTLAGAGTVYIRKTAENITNQYGSLQSQTEYSYDSPQNGNITALKEWKYYTGTPNSTPDRETDFTYQTASSYTNKHIINLVTEKTVKNLAGTILAETMTIYDGSTPTSVTGVFNHDDTNYGTSDTTRGNPTTIQQWVSGSTYLSSTFTYDTTGQVTSATDPDNHVTTYSHADNFFTDSSGYTNPPTAYTPSTPTNAYLTTVTLPVSGTKTYGYYFGDGKQALSQDQNLQTTYSHYEPMMNCLANTSFPDGGYASNTYTAGTECTGASTYNGLSTVSMSMDSMSRPSSAANGPMSAGVSYNPTSQVSSSTNPYESINDPTYGVTTYGYDGWGRIESTVYADGDSTTVLYGSNTGISQLCSASTYGYGYPTETYDQAGNNHETWADGFGRTIEVDEPNSYNQLTIGTCYQYDALGNLTQVVQGSQTRSYQYDGLSRMISETTPEAGTTDYYYTLSGGSLCAGATDAICRRTDSGGILTSYAYDAENRLTSKTYSDGTATAKYYYDQASVTVSSTQYTLSNTKGRLSQTTVGAQSETIHSYDPMGRTQDLWECTPYNCSSTSLWNIHYTYDAQGDPITWSHPAGFTITSDYYNFQEVNEITSSLNDGTHPTSLIWYNYGGSGQPENSYYTCPNDNCSNGTPYFEDTYDYNNRLQPVRIQIGLTPDLCVVYNYHVWAANPTSCIVPTGSMANNNGAVIGEYVQDNSNPSLGHTTSYTYDYLNRLLTSVATPGQTGGAAHNLAFSYDQYGNMTCVQRGSTNGPCPQVTFTATTNQLSTSGFTYNVQGDLTGDGTHTYQWDAEGRLKSVDSGTTATYTYNALGWRVEKKLGSAYTEYLFGASGDRLGENNRTTWTESYVPLGYGQYAIYQNNATYFTHPNALGSTTMVTDYDGNVVQDKLFYPWGQDWQTIGTVYDERFAKLQRRDTETSLDPTPNRTFASVEGRWVTPDPAAAGTNLTNPQSLNRYPYALNNPATLADPSGLLVTFPSVPFGCLGEDGLGFPVDICAGAWYLPLIPVIDGGAGGGGGWLTTVKCTCHSASQENLGRCFFGCVCSQPSSVNVTASAFLWLSWGKCAGGCPGLHEGACPNYIEITTKKLPFGSWVPSFLSDTKITKCML